MPNKKTMNLNNCEDLTALYEAITQKETLEKITQLSLGYLLIAQLNLETQEANLETNNTTGGTSTLLGLSEAVLKINVRKAAQLMCSPVRVDNRIKGNKQFKGITREALEQTLELLKKEYFKLFSDIISKSLEQKGYKIHNRCLTKITRIIIKEWLEEYNPILCGISSAFCLKLWKEYHLSFILSFLYHAPTTCIENQAQNFLDQTAIKAEQKKMIQKVTGYRLRDFALENIGDVGSNFFLSLILATNSLMAPIILVLYCLVFDSLPYSIAASLPLALIVIFVATSEDYFTKKNLLEDNDFIELISLVIRPTFAFDTILEQAEKEAIAHQQQLTLRNSYSIDVPVVRQSSVVGCKAEYDEPQPQTKRVKVKTRKQQENPRNNELTLNQATPKGTHAISIGELEMLYNTSLATMTQNRIPRNLQESHFLVRLHSYNATLDAQIAGRTFHLIYLNLQQLKNETKVSDQTLQRHLLPTMLNGIFRGVSRGKGESTQPGYYQAKDGIKFKPKNQDVKHLRLWFKGQKQSTNERVYSLNRVTHK